ncbi:MAG: hypothetical protein K9L68_11015 [Spirochaetales bacterium]|nr:hypothetical protein [Spirochaetales bacterium]MCF7939116.1 hypothetical protein [Spirochaetales bacterium]
MIKVQLDRNNTYQVVVDEGGSSTTHMVTLEDGYYQKLTGGKESKEDLIQRSFEFLLQRESKESILRSFDLPIIGRYFPDYESKISLK